MQNEQDSKWMIEHIKNNTWDYTHSEMCNEIKNHSIAFLASEGSNLWTSGLVQMNYRHKFIFKHFKQKFQIPQS